MFFEGDFYDAYSLLLDIFNKVKEEIIIIDNYAGKELLDILKKKYESQNKNVTFINNNSFHDRFIILDRNKLFLRL